MSEEYEISHTIDKIIKANNDSISTIHDYNIDIKANHIYLFCDEAYSASLEEQGIEFIIANKFIRNLNILMRLSSNPILVHMKTGGGFWNQGMAIYDAIKSCPNQITILVYTEASSMSSIILQSADKRILMKHSHFLFHGGSSMFAGTYKQVMAGAKVEKIMYDQMMSIYVDSMKLSGKYKKRSRVFIKEWLTDQMNQKEDVYMTSTEAVIHGFADETFGKDGIYNWKSLLEF